MKNKVKPFIMEVSKNRNALKGYVFVVGAKCNYTKIPIEIPKEMLVIDTENYQNLSVEDMEKKLNIKVMRKKDGRRIRRNLSKTKRNKTV